MDSDIHVRDAHKISHLMTSRGELSRSLPHTTALGVTRASYEMSSMPAFKSYTHTV